MVTPKAAARQLRVELRRSVAPPAALAAAALLCLLLRIRHDEWAGGWTGLALTLRNDLPVLVPLALAAGAWQGGRERRAGTEELVTSTPRPAGQRVLMPAAAVVLALLVALCGPLAAAGVLGGRGRWLGQAWPAGVLAVGLLAVAAAVLLGVGLGRAVRSNLVAPLALVVLFLPLLAFTATSYVDSWPRLLTPALEPTADDVDAVRGAVTGGQAAWYGALLAAGVVLAVADRWRTRALAVVPALAGLAVAVPLLSSGGGAAYADDPTASRLICATGLPEVCVTAVHQAALPTVVAPARQVLAALQQLPGSPTRAVEQAHRVPRTPAAADVLPLRAREPLVGDLAAEFADGLGTPVCLSSPGGPLDAVHARQVAGSWLLHAPLPRGRSPEPAQVLQRLRRLPGGEQVQRMTDLRAALRSCDRDPMELLP